MFFLFPPFFFRGSKDRQEFRTKAHLQDFHLEICQCFYTDSISRLFQGQVKQWFLFFFTSQPILFFKQRVTSTEQRFGFYSLQTQRPKSLLAESLVIKWQMLERRALESCQQGATQFKCNLETGIQTRAAGFWCRFEHPAHTESKRPSLKLQWETTVDESFSENVPVSPVDQSLCEPHVRRKGCKRSVENQWPELCSGQAGWLVESPLQPWSYSKPGRNNRTVFPGMMETTSSRPLIIKGTESLNSVLQRWNMLSSTQRCSTHNVGFGDRIMSGKQL